MQMACYSSSILSLNTSRLLKIQLLLIALELYSHCSTKSSTSPWTLFSCNPTSHSYLLLYTAQYAGVSLGLFKLKRSVLVSVFFNRLRATSGQGLCHIHLCISCTYWNGWHLIDILEMFIKINNDLRTSWRAKGKKKPPNRSVATLGSPEQGCPGLRQLLWPRCHFKGWKDRMAHACFLLSSLWVEQT